MPDDRLAAACRGVSRERLGAAYGGKLPHWLENPWLEANGFQPKPRWTIANYQAHLRRMASFKDGLELKAQQVALVRPVSHARRRSAQSHRRHLASRAHATRGPPGGDEPPPEAEPPLAALRGLAAAFVRLQVHLARRSAAWRAAA
jgi:hypothetical protein